MHVTRPAGCPREKSTGKRARADTPSTFKSEVNTAMEKRDGTIDLIICG